MAMCTGLSIIRLVISGQGKRHVYRTPLTHVLPGSISLTLRPRSFRAHVDTLLCSADALRRKCDMGSFSHSKVRLEIEGVEKFSRCSETK